MLVWAVTDSPPLCPFARRRRVRLVVPPPLKKEVRIGAEFAQVAQPYGVVVADSALSAGLKTESPNRLQRRLGAH
jgi:hypothetical protein